MIYFAEIHNENRYAACIIEGPELPLMDPSSRKQAVEIIKGQAAQLLNPREGEEIELVAIPRLPWQIVNLDFSI